MYRNYAEHLGYTGLNKTHFSLKEFVILKMKLSAQDCEVVKGKSLLRPMNRVINMWSRGVREKPAPSALGKNRGRLFREEKWWGRTGNMGMALYRKGMANSLWLLSSKTVIVHCDASKKILR